MMKIALFDFCGTIVDLQSADEFVLFTLKKNHRLGCVIFFLLLKSKIISRVCNLFGMNCDFKGKYLRLLSGLTFQQIENASIQYADFLFEKHIINETYKKLVELSQNGYDIWIVSAGYSCYLNHFLPNVVGRVIATNLKFSSGIVTGYLDGLDCIGEEKINRLKAEVVDSGFEYSVAFSDSDSDLPLLSISKKGIVVSKNASQPWAKENGFEEIVWHR